MPKGATAASIGLVLAAAVAFVALSDDGSRGEPFAIGTIVARAPPPVLPARDPDQTGAVPSKAASAPAEAAQPTATAPQPGKGQDIRIENGVVVIRSMGGGGNSPLTLRVPEPARQKENARAIDPDLIEATASGPLPRVGRDGTRPADVYAATPVPADGKPRIAIVIGGMGLDRKLTAEADLALPSSVTFGFAPYGDDVGGQATRARQSGHEIVLQAPMEDFGRPGQPLPHLLRVEDGANPENLHWLMGRFAGYAGIGNSLGGRLLADEATLRPLMQEVAARGLYFFDDGTASRSLAPVLARDLGVASVRADVVLDAQLGPGSLSLALSNLERIARERGAAVGSATARRESNAMIAEFVAGASKRGLVVVPVSQAIAAGKSLQFGQQTLESKP